MHNSAADFPASLRSVPGYRLAALRAARRGDHLPQSRQTSSIPAARENNSVLESHRSPGNELAHSADVAAAAVQLGAAGVATVQAGDGDTSRSVARIGFKTVTPARRASEGVSFIHDSNPSLALRAGVETASVQPADIELTARAEAQFELAAVPAIATGSTQAVHEEPGPVVGDDAVVAAIVEVPVPQPSSENAHSSAIVATADARPEIGVPAATAIVHTSRSTTDGEQHAPEPELRPTASRFDNSHEHVRPTASSHPVTAKDSLKSNSDSALTQDHAEHFEADRQIVAHTGDAAAARPTSMDQLPAAGTGEQTPLGRLMSKAGNGAAPPVSDAPVAHRVSEAIAAWREVATERGTARFAAWLTPPELGHVWVELTSSKHGITARLAAADDSVQSLLEAQAPTLRQSLADAGVTLAEFDVSSGSGQGSPQGDHDHAPHSQRTDSYPQLRPTRAVPSRPAGTINVRA
jgi:hypothetical protein